MPTSSEHFFHRNELIQIFDACLNKTLGELDINNIFDKTILNPKITGIAGDVVEQSILGYSADTRQEPDLNVDGIYTELKTTGIRCSKKERNKYDAKEPMSITAVSPDRIVTEVFENSKFWHKLNHLLFVYYLYSSDKTVPASEYANFPVKGYQFYEFNKEDKATLENDWTTVHDFIVELQSSYTDYKNEYPRLSSELRNKLLFIDTAPKWPNPPRFRLKRAVISNIVQEHFGNELEQLPGKYTSYADIDHKCHELTKFYSGQTVKQLVDYFLIKGNIEDKSISERIIVRMFDGQAKKMQKIDLFNKIGLLAKSVVVTQSGLRTEDMKLFCIDFEELANPDIEFEDSSFRDYFADNQMMCIIFEEPSIDAPFMVNKLLGFKRLTFDDNFIETQVKPIWNDIRRLIFNYELVDVIKVDKKTGQPQINKGTGTVQSAPNFPKSSEGLIFVRGSGSDSTKKPEEINGIRMYRQYIWIKGVYIVRRLSEINFL